MSHDPENKKKDKPKKEPKTYTMYIAYSALQTVTQQTEAPKAETLNHELQLRYQAFKTTCSKYHREIAAIQQYLPGWSPKFY